MLFDALIADRMPGGRFPGRIPPNTGRPMAGLHRSTAPLLAVLVMVACEPGEPAVRQPPAQTINLRQTLVLSGSAGAEIRIGAQVVRDSRGRYYVSRLMNPATIAVYDARGRLRHTFGTRGGGPGEFYAVDRVFVSPGDSLFVVDRSNQVSVFSPDHRFVRSFRPRVSVAGMAFAADGRLVISNYEPLSLPALVLTDRQGQGATGLGPRSTDRSERPRLVVLGDSGGIWAACRDRYSIELLDLSEARRYTVDRRLPWFGPEPPRRRAPPARGAIRDYVYDPHTASLSVLLSRSRPDFRPPAAGTGPTHGESRPGRLDAGQLRARFDLFLEVLDGRSGRLLAEGHLGNRIVAGFISPMDAYGYQEREDGSIEIAVWEVSLSNREQPGR